MTRLAVVCTLLLACSAVAQESPAEAQRKLAETIEGLVKIQSAFESLNPLGVSVRMKEIAREGKSGGELTVKYHIFLDGVPPDSMFDLVTWPINQEQAMPVLQGLSLGKDGLLMCAARKPGQCGDPQKPDDPIDFVFMPAKGEPSRLALVSGELKIGIVIVPDPVESKDKGCTLHALRLTPGFELALVTGAGYPPNTDVRYRFNSGPTTEGLARSSEKGTIRFAVVPSSPGKTGGSARVKILSGACLPEVHFEWGTK